MLKARLNNTIYYSYIIWFRNKINNKIMKEKLKCPVCGKQNKLQKFYDAHMFNKHTNLSEFIPVELEEEEELVRELVVVEYKKKPENTKVDEVETSIHNEIMFFFNGLGVELEEEELVEELVVVEYKKKMV